MITSLSDPVLQSNFHTNHYYYVRLFNEVAKELLVAGLRQAKMTEVFMEVEQVPT